MRVLTILAAMLSISVSLRAGEEKIRGLLEKTNKAGACAQITDALAEVYYINKTDENEKAVAKYLGKNEKVVLTGTVESKEGDPSYFFALKSVEQYAPKMPPAPPAPATPPAAVTPPPVDPKAETKPNP